MKICIQITYTFILMLFGTVLGWAQELEEEPRIQFTARAFGNDFFQEIYFYNANDEREAIEFDPYGRTRVYAVPEDQSEIAFLRVFQDEQGREQEETIAVGDIESIESRAFLVVIANRDSLRNLPYTVFVADESPGEFEAGHLRFLNLAVPPLLARVGERTLTLEPGFGGDRRGALRICGAYGR